MPGVLPRLGGSWETLFLVVRFRFLDRGYAQARSPTQVVRIEFVAQAVENWIKAVDARTAYIAPASLWENGICESFNVPYPR